jgi:alpha-galactosidase/6-phospho-beta-glucosidase family protein
LSALKIVIIGGGSVNWMPRLAADLFLNEALRGGRLVLVDINRESAELLLSYCRTLNERIGTGWSVEIADLETALDGADGVCASISTGWLDAMENDISIPEKFGIYHSVGDTVGPGGISRTLRNVPVFVDIARKMEKLCPDTWLVHVTNPLAQITRAVWRASEIRSLGLCHNFTGTRHLMAKYLGGEPSDVFATSVGVNHCSWLKDLTFRGKPAEDRLSLQEYHAYEARKHAQPLKTGTGDDEIAQETGENTVPRYLLNFVLYDRLGVFPAGAAAHVAENFPYFMNTPEAIERHQIHRKQLHTRRSMYAKKRQKLVDIIEGRSPWPEPEESADMVAAAMAALITGKETPIVVNVPNEGQVSNLPRDAVVETWALLSWNTVRPVHAGPVPLPVSGVVENIVVEEELAVEAALTGDRKKVLQAMHASAMVQDKDRAGELADALIKANLKWLPQFAE